MPDHVSEGEAVGADLNVLVLAGRRGPHEPLAQAAGCSHKALIPIHGIPMLDRVVRTLRTVQGVQRVVISTDEPSSLESLDELRELDAAGLLHFHGVGDSPSASVLKYLSQLPAGELLLVITADHPLLTTDMLEYFCAEARHNDADVTVGVMAESLFRTHYPDSKRSFIPLRGERFCGTNLFALRGGSGAKAAATFWNHAGQFRKRPWRLVSTFGVWNLLLIALQRLDAEAARKSAEKVIGARIAVVQMPFVECAIDVDNPADLVLVTHILSEREVAGGDA
jgi:molybdopterin-guanine dinucleotide biosynthesis protein A